MATITQILFRRGTDATRQTTLLASGEPGLTTDSNRLFVGDGVTPGGNIAGNINFGAFNNVINNAYSNGLDPSTVPYLSAGQIGDLIFDDSTNIVYCLSTTPNGTPNANQLYVFARNVTLSSSEFFYGPNSQLCLATQGISGFHISQAALDQDVITFNSNSQLTLSQGTALSGVSNNNFQWAAANSVKGNFTGAVSAITDLQFLTGYNVYQFLGTANNTGLGVVGLSAGQNITFSTVSAAESNGQVVNAVVIDSSPNIEAGDGITYNYDPNSGHNAISTYNSIQYLRTGDFYYNSSVSAANISPGDGSIVPTLVISYLSATNSQSQKLSNIPTFSFETVAPVSRPPLVTIYWTTTGSGGSNVTVFATNSALKPVSFSNAGYIASGSPRSALFPSYWQDYSWQQAHTTSAWVGGDSGNGDGNRRLVTSTYYTTQTILANWPASINCMYLSAGTAGTGNRLFVGGNFMNLGPTTTQNQGSNVRYGIACINLSGGAVDTVGNTGAIGQVETFTGTTPGANILNSASTGGTQYGLTLLSPGYSVNQITAYNNYLCVGGCWKEQGKTSDGSTQPSTSLALFDTTNNYTLSAYNFIAYNPANANKPDVPATITSLLSVGSFLYVAGNFYKCKLASDSNYITNCVGIARIKLNNTNTGFNIDNQVIGSIDQDFTQYTAGQLYDINGQLSNINTANLGSQVWRYPVVCLDAIPYAPAVPSLSSLSGGYVLYAGGRHWVAAPNQASTNYRYQNLTTHWIGNSAQGRDGSLTNFNALINGPVNIITHNPNSSFYNVYIGGKFTTFTSARQTVVSPQNSLIPCNNVIALDTAGFQTPYTQNTDNTQNSNTNTYTSADAPIIIQNWIPAFNDEVTGIEFQESNPNTPYGTPLSAAYFTGRFTAIGTTKAPYAAAVVLPAYGANTIFTGLFPAPWMPAPNAPFTTRGGKGSNILRIPYTNPLSGVVLGGTASFATVLGNARPSFARVSGLGEMQTQALSTVTWCIAPNVLGQGNYINIDNTFVASLCDPVLSPYVVNAAQFSPKSFPALAHVHRGDLCRFVIYRPGNWPGAFNITGRGIPTDTYSNNVQVLGVKVDWDTGTAVGEYAYNGFNSTIYAPPSGTSNVS